MVVRIYELTTNGRGGFAKWLVKGIKSDEEARKVALKGFGKKYYSAVLISYYDNWPSEYGNDYSKVPTIKEFIKQARKEYKY